MPLRRASAARASGAAVFWDEWSSSSSSVVVDGVRTVEGAAAVATSSSLWLEDDLRDAEAPDETADEAEEAGDLRTIASSLLLEGSLNRSSDFAPRLLYGTIVRMYDPSCSGAFGSS